VIDAHLQATGIALKVRLSLASNEAIRDLVASGMGLTVLSRQALGEEPERHGLAVLDVADFPLRNRWHVVHLRNKLLSLPARAFLDDLRTSAAGAPPAP
jgi:DNA-binding transcriptional LysR family regulator